MWNEISCRSIKQHLDYQFLEETNGSRLIEAFERSFELLKPLLMLYHGREEVQRANSVAATEKT